MISEQELKSWLRERRRQKLLEIENKAMEVRRRGFVNTPYIRPFMEDYMRFGLHLFLIAIGEIPRDKMLRVRNIKNHNTFEDVPAQKLVDNMKECLKCRDIIQAEIEKWRNKVQAIYNSKELTVESKVDAIERLVVPDFLGIDEG